jgi:hypothetical protein
MRNFNEFTISNAVMERLYRHCITISGSRFYLASATSPAELVSP